MVPSLEGGPGVGVSFGVSEPTPPLIVRAAPAPLLNVPATVTVPWELPLPNVRVPVLLSAPLTLTVDSDPLSVREPALLRFAPTFNVLVVPPAMPDTVTVPSAVLRDF